MLTDGQRAVLGPLIEACRPLAKVAPQNLRQTMDAILWHHQNGAKWRAVPEVLGPWWKAAQTFIRWSSDQPPSSGPMQMSVEHEALVLS